MREQRSSYFGLCFLWIAGLSVVAWGPPPAAAGPPATPPIHDESFVSINDGDECSAITTLYSVPAGRKLLIEWVGIESNAFTQADPVDVDIEVNPGGGAVQHPIVRLDNSVNMSGSFFFSQRWSGEVRLYGTSSTDVRAQACRNGTTDDHSVRITWSGRLTTN